MPPPRRRRIIVAYPSPRSTAQPAVKSGGIGRERQERTMQSPFVAQLAEIRHNDLHAEAARRRIIDRTWADRQTAIAAVASARGRVRMALANAAVGLRKQ